MYVSYISIVTRCEKNRTEIGYYYRYYIDIIHYRESVLFRGKM